MAKKSKQKGSEIESKYIQYILKYGEDPPSIHAFTKKAKIKEEFFYKKYSSFEGIRIKIWKNFLKETFELLEEDKLYQSYPIREKLLTFYYTHLEVLKKYRSFILATSEGLDRPGPTPKVLKKYRSTFLSYAKDLIKEGRKKGQILERKYISDQYHHGLWIQCLVLLNYWIKDLSLGAENTDAAIEKSVNVSFDLISEGRYDSLLDLGKFFFQTWNKS